MSLQWIPWGKGLNMEEFNTKKGKGGVKDNALIIDKDGSLKTVGEYGQISSGRSAYYLGRPPYLFKIPKIRGITHCSENVCTRKTYNLWRNTHYKAVYAVTLRDVSHRHLAIRELEMAD